MQNLLEKTELTLGYMPLTDSLPLICAERLGCFADEGLQVTLRREVSWANIRDRLVLGQIDAAQMLAPMLLAASAGLGGLATPLLTGLALNLNGNAVTVSRALAAEMAAVHPAPIGLAAAQALRRVIDRRRAEGRPDLVLASVFLFSCHHYQLRYWLRAAGIDPERDLQLVVLPPEQMVDGLRAGEIDGFCVGEPWNSWALQQGLGYTVATGFDIWNNGPEKVLGVTQLWADEHPNTHLALLRALYRAGEWLEDERHHEQAAAWLVEGAHVQVGIAAVLPALRGRLPMFGRWQEQPDMLVFHRYAANFPWHTHARFLYQQMQASGQLADTVNIEPLISRSYRPDLLRQALDQELPLPLLDERPLGLEQSCWPVPASAGALLLGPDRLIDGAAFF